MQEMGRLNIHMDEKEKNKMDRIKTEKKVSRWLIIALLCKLEKLLAEKTLWPSERTADLLRSMLRKL